MGWRDCSVAVGVVKEYYIEFGFLSDRYSPYTIV